MFQLLFNYTFKLLQPKTGKKADFVKSLTRTPFGPVFPTGPGNPYKTQNCEIAFWVSS